MNEHVQIVFKNRERVSGIVISEQPYVLTDMVSENTIFIPDKSEILYIKTYHNKQQKNNPNPELVISQDLPEVPKTDSQELRMKSLIELRTLAKKQEQERISNLIKSEERQGLSEVEYGGSAILLRGHGVLSGPKPAQNSSKKETRRSRRRAKRKAC